MDHDTRHHRSHHRRLLRHPATEKPGSLACHLGDAEDYRPRQGRQDGAEQPGMDAADDGRHHLLQ